MVPTIPSLIYICRLDRFHLCDCHSTFFYCYLDWRGMGSNTESISEQLVQTVAAHTRTDPLELPCLYETVDPDALNTVINKMANGMVSFPYAGITVVVLSDGTIRIIDDFMPKEPEDEDIGTT